ncbi:hypothetical protein [Microcoleus sp. EPA2]|uniref:hypothetical protein n=1 Tax=Microcoleus sp. EPA2 TaxID=2841654 RepID=UPI00312B7F11
MEISTFELLAKPIAPAIPGAPQLATVARRVVQGYFLTISNLEAIDLRYRIEFTVSLPIPADSNKILLGNAQLIVDVEGNNTILALTQKPGDPKVYRGFFTIPAHKTASVELLPALPGVLSASMLEVRGYVSLFLPPRFKFPFSVPQTEKPVRVLLNPEIRGTFLPNGFPGVVGDLDFDQINYTLAIASGKALNMIPPEPGLPIILEPQLVSQVLEDLREGNLEVSSVEADNSEKAKMLVELLVQIDSNEPNLKAINTVMDKFDIPVRISRN